MLNFFRKINQKRVLYTRVCLTTLVFMAMVLICFLFVNGIVHQHLLQNTEKSLDYAQYQIEALLLESEITLDGFARSVRDMIIMGYDKDLLQQYFDDLSVHLSGSKTHTSNVRNLYGYIETLPEGPAFFSGADSVGSDAYAPAHNQWYRDAVAAAGKPVEILVNEETEARETIITYAMCIYDDDDLRLGVICADFVFDSISQTLAETSEAINGIGLLVSPDLTVIYHNNPEFVNKPLRNPKLPLAIFADALERGEEITEQPVVDYLGQQSVVFVRHLPNNWLLGLVIPKGPYFEPVTRMIVVLLAVGAVFAAAMIFILVRTDSAYEDTRRLVNMNPLAVILWDRGVNIIDCNDEFLRLFGLKTKDETIRRFYEFSPEHQPDGQTTKEKAAACIKKAFHDGRYELEWMHQAPDGSPIPVEITLIRVPYKKDFLIAAYARDLREQKKMMEDIHAASARLSAESSTIKTMFDLAPDQIFCKDIDLNYIRCNHSLLDYFHLKEEDVIGKGDADGLSLPEDIVEAHRVMDRQVMATREIYVYEESVPDLAGNSHVFETSKLPLIENGEVTGLMGIAHDITARKEMEESAYRANKAKSAFLANMSHEIRTPMNTILGIAEIQLQDDELTSTVREALNMMYNAGELLLGIINDLLDMSKIEADKFELILAKFEVASLINDTMMLNMARVGSKSIEFELYVEENVPAMLVGDELRIKQILNNVLSNAFKYTKQGTVRFSVTVDTEDNQPADMITVVFKVTDTGIGMSAEQIDKLFDEYIRFNVEANRGTQGTGLGMSITKNLVSKMGGAIAVASEVNKGSEFTIRIPQEKVGDSVIGKELAENLRMFRTNGVKQIKRASIMVEPMPYGSVMIVDDVEANLYVAKGLMKPYMLAVDTVISGYDAIERIKNGKIYDIIFMDHMMPGMDGVEATSIIRGMGYTRPIVALTANAVVGQSDKFLENGFDAFIAKPIDTRALNAVLKRFIRDKQPPAVIEAARLLQAAGAVARESGIKAVSVTVNRELAEIFLRDVQKALAVLDDTMEKRETFTDADLHAFVIAVHGMKSILAGIGESDLSAFAGRLEKSGRNNEVDVVFGETPAFIGRLKTLMVKYKPDEMDDAAGDYMPYLREKLHAIGEACLAYDGMAAEAELIGLKQRSWPAPVRELLSKLAEQLLHSDFEDIARSIDGYLSDE